MDWMVNAVITSLPRSTCIDEATIRKTLVETGGHLDTAVSKLLDYDSQSSNSSSPSSPDTFSSSGGSGIDRDLDSDDEEEISGPNKRQNRRMKAMKARAKVELDAIPTLDTAVSKLLDYDTQSSNSSNPSSPDTFSSSGGSSIERDLDSDDEEEISGPNKRQNRRMKAMKARAEVDSTAIPTLALDEPHVKEPTISGTELPPLSNVPAASKQVVIKPRPRAQKQNGPQPKKAQQRAEPTTKEMPIRVNQALFI
jgi:hypothetical protein